MKKEIISKFKEKPKTKITWWAMYLGLTTMLGGPVLGIFASVIRPMIDEAGNNENIGRVVGFIVMIGALVLLISALVTSIRAFKLGERSWVLWIGFIPAMLASAFWLFMIIGEFLFPH